VFDDAQVLDTCLGHDGDAGILAGLEPGGILAVHATVAPSTIHTLAASAAERGVHVLDVAMTGGGGQAAAEGALTFMIGGDAEPVERARPALEAMAKNLFHVGALGTGVTAKIINNCMGISHVVLVREALRLAGAVGIDDETILTIINAGGVGSNWASINWDRIRAQETTHTSGKAGMVGMASKDTQLGLDLATERGISLPTLAFLVHEVIPDLAATGLTG
jgi:3-hydroxyisobutyrate dehydrogenase